MQNQSINFKIMKPIRLLLVLFMLLAVSFSYAQEQEREVKTFTEVVTPYVEKLVDLADKGTDFVIAETPIVIRQFLYFEASKHLFFIFLGFLLITIFKTYITNILTVISENKPESKLDYIDYEQISQNRWLRKEISNDGDVTAEQGFYYFLKHACVILGIMIIITHILPTIKIIFFPKLYLIETFLNII